MENNTVENTDLATYVEDINPVAVFQEEGGDRKILERIEKAALAIVTDASTAKGRKDIASLAYKVSRSKTALDNAGKTLVDDWKAKAKVVDARRKRIRDSLDKLRDIVREPLTKWEEAETARIKAFEDQLATWKDSGAEAAMYWKDHTLDEHEIVLAELESVVLDETWEAYGFFVAAQETLEMAISRVKKAIEDRKQWDAEQAELEKLRQDNAQAEKDKIAQDAADKAREDERKRIADEQAEEARQKAAREKDREHRRKINATTSAELQAHAKLDKKQAEKVVECLARGLISNVTINY